MVQKSTALSLAHALGNNCLAVRRKLSKFTFRRCATNELKNLGWRPPRGDQPLVYSYNQQWMLTLESEQRLLPASVVNQLTQERAAELEQQQGYAPGKTSARTQRVSGARVDA